MQCAHSGLNEGERALFFFPAMHARGRRTLLPNASARLGAFLGGRRDGDAALAIVCFEEPVLVELTPCLLCGLPAGPHVSHQNCSRLGPLFFRVLHSGLTRGVLLALARRDSRRTHHLTFTCALRSAAPCASEASEARGAGTSAATYLRDSGPGAEKTCVFQFLHSPGERPIGREIFGAVHECEAFGAEYLRKAPLQSKHDSSSCLRAAALGKNVAQVCHGALRIADFGKCE
mmetsp:Transcript_3308/g.10109  ORF Transcript_3308/g.10109 Transcript_3308/m.10109 type:complete len:232 (-) Transcript_3308:128-823(-)